MLMIQVDYDDPFYLQWFHELIQGSSLRSPQHLCISHEAILFTLTNMEVGEQQ